MMRTSARLVGPLWAPLFVCLGALGCRDDRLADSRAPVDGVDLAPEDEEEPAISIDVWYGPIQRFGVLGVPQPTINILGNVAPPPGRAITLLEYSLNDAPRVMLSVGPDDRRLAEPGDFNIDLEIWEVDEGENTLEIFAADDLGNEASELVLVEFDPEAVWPLPYTARWEEGPVDELAWVVDGLWDVEEGVLRPVQIAYDRIVAIGDRTWTDYEVTAPITIHGIDPSGFEPPSNGPGIGLALRWPGHRDLRGEQPDEGFLPLGAIGWYHFEKEGSNLLQILGNDLGQSNRERSLELDVPYIFKMRVETVTEKDGLYRLKVWRASEPEPAGWDIERHELSGDPQCGSALLIAHHVDASFGDVEAIALD